MPCLGHIIASDGGIRPCWEEARRKMWKSFWANAASREIAKAPTDMKMKLLSRSTVCIVQFKWSRWPPQKKVALELTLLQTRMLATILRVQRRPLEDMLDYIRRRNKQAKAVARAQGMWYHLWWKRCIAWHKHVNRHTNTPMYQILACHGQSWLRAQRFPFVPAHSSFARAWTIDRGRSGTRCRSGYVSKRWEEGILLAETCRDIEQNT